MTIAWKAEYETGDAHIDRQHQELVTLAALFSQAFEKRMASEVIDQAVEALLAYVDYHFKDEERYWQRIGSRLCKAHKAAHQELRQEIADLAAERDLGFINFEEELLEWLRTRLVTHMMRDDRAAFEARTRDAAPEVDTPSAG